MFFEISERSHQEIQYNSKSSSKCVHMNKDFKAPRCGYFSRNYIKKKKKKGEWMWFFATNDSKSLGLQNVCGCFVIVVFFRFERNFLLTFRKNLFTSGSVKLGFQFSKKNCVKHLKEFLAINAEDSDWKLQVITF